MAWPDAPILGLATVVVACLTVWGFVSGRRRAIVSRQAASRLATASSLPTQHGLYVAMWAALPALVVVFGLGVIAAGLAAHSAATKELTDRFGELSPAELRDLWREVERVAAGEVSPQSVEPAIVAAGRVFESTHFWLRSLVAGLAMGLSFVLMVWARGRVAADFRARERVEAAVKRLLLGASAVAVLTTFGIVASLLGETLRFFFQLPSDWWRVWAWETRVPAQEFFFGLQWSPQEAVREGQVGQTGAFGMIPLIYGTLYITLIAMLVAAPIGIYSAIYLSEYAGPRTRAWFKPILEVLAGIPTVVYGFFALLTVGPFIRELAELAGLDARNQSALAAGLVMGVMIIPFVSSLSDDVINAAPQSLRDGALALGATKSEMVRQVILPAALPGVMAALLLAISRAVGETMIVVMAAGQAANLSPNPLDSLTTITVQITKFFTGDQEFSGAKTLSAFALGLVLFTLTLIMNIIALTIVRRYREKYE